MTIRVGLVGYGLGGAVFHAPFIATTPELELAAIVTRDPERQAHAARAHPGARILSEVERLWAPDANVDLVVIATPNRTHAPLALAALAAGRHVVVDKPFTPTVAEARAVAEEARRRGLMLTVYQNRRWDGDFRTLRTLLNAGELGTPLRFDSRFERWRPVPKPGWRETVDPDEAGGILYDLGSHLIDQSLVLFGPVREVYAEIERRRPGAEADDDVFMALLHTAGVRSHLHLSAVAAQPGARMRLLGSLAAYSKWGRDVQEEALRAGERPGSTGWGMEPPEQWGTLGTTDGSRRVPTERSNFGAFWAQLARSMLDGTSPPVDPQDAIAGLAVIEAAMVSAAERTVVRLD